jgi:hypothetical protein
LATNALTWEIFDQPHGNPDSDGDSMGVYLNDTGSGGAYSNGVGLLAFLGAHKSAESAQSDILEFGPYAGQSIYDFMVDALDQFAFSQVDSLSGYHRGGWQYIMNNANNYGVSDNSAVQWPALVIEAAENNWGMAMGLGCLRWIELGKS